MRLMMVAVPAPTKSMHDIFMACPGDEFHREKGGDHGQYDGEKRHGYFITLARGWPPEISTDHKWLLEAVATYIGNCAANTENT
jgi:hypothetical protein